MIFLFLNKIVNCNELITILLMFWCFGHRACAILVLLPGMKALSHALEGGILSTGPPGKPLLPLPMTPPFNIACSITFHLLIHQLMGIWWLPLVEVK